MRIILPAAATVVALATALPGAAVAAECGGALADLGLRPHCPPRAPAPAEPDPGGVESPDQPVPPVGKHFGFNTSLYVSEQAASPAQELDALSAAGATAVRIPVPWKSFQPSAGTPLPEPTGEEHDGSSIQEVDLFYAGAVERGITPIFMTGAAPLWATRYARCPLLDFRCQQIARSSYPIVPERHYLDEYTGFVAAVKARWPRALIESWNEPDLYWGNANFQGSRAFYATPEYFKDIQCAVYAGSKRVNADPVLAPGWSMQGNADYVRRVYAAGGAACWDLANAHAYPQRSDLGASTPFAQTMHLLRGFRQTYGDTDPIWITETGYTTTSEYGVSEATQAEASGRLYNRLATMPDVGAVLFHTLRDGHNPAHSPGAREYGYGFLREDWTPKLVYCSFTARAGTPAC